MAISRVDMEVPDAVSVALTDDALIVELSDGRGISAPLAWYPRLLHATNEERERWRISAQPKPPLLCILTGSSQNLATLSSRSTCPRS